MSADPRDPRRQREAVHLQERDHAGWRERVDPIFLCLVLLAAVTLGAGLLLVVELGRTTLQHTDQPVTRVRDARLLDNVYKKGTGFQNAAYDAAGDQILVAASDGAMAAYHRGSGLWRELPPARTDQPQSLLALQADGGETALGDDGNRVWAFYRDGYLTRFQDDQWRPFTKASRFLNLAQEPVQQEDLAAAAQAPDGTWLALADNKGALGLYNQTTREWWPVPIDIQTQLSWAPIEVMTWWRDALWIGTRQGLIALRFPGRVNATLQEIEALSGEIKSLFVDDNDRLVALSHGSCAEQGNQCVRIHRFDEPEETPTTLLDTYDQPAGFGLNQLREVHQSGDDLFLAGESGLLQYNLAQHSRRLLEKSRINDSLMHHDGQTILFAGNAVLGRADAFGVNRWTVPGHLFYQLSQRPGGEVYAISDKGAVFEIQDDRPPIQVFSGEGSQLDPSRFFTAVTIDDYLLMVGTDGAMLHHLRERSYRDLPKSSRNAWLLEPSTRLHSSSGHLYALSSLGGEVFARTIPLQMVIDGNLRLPKTLSSVPAPVRRVRDWKGQGLGLIGGDGAAYLLTPSQTFAMTGAGPAPAALSGRRGRVYDVLSNNQSLLVSTQEGFHEYLYDRRAWRNLGEPPTRTAAVDLAHWGDQVLFRTDTNRLARINRFRPYLIGGPRLIDMGDDQLRDVLLDEQVLYLAGNAKVVAYDLQQRWVKTVWAQDGAEDQRIRALVGGEPLVLASGKAYLGDRRLFEDSVVAQLSYDGTSVWAVLQQETGRMLKGLHPNLGTTRCLFRHPYPHDGALRFDGVAELPNGHLAVLTERGLQFYNPYVRSWFRGKEPIMRRGGRLVTVGDHLLLVEQDEGRDGRGTLWHIPIRSIRASEACSDEPYTFQAFRHDGRGFTIDARGEQAAWVDARGNLQRWQRGSLTAASVEQATATPTTGPPRQALRAVFVGPKRENLIFATDDQVVRYHLPKRRMTQLELVFEEAAVTPYRINMQYDDLGQVWHLSLKDARDRLFRAEWDGAGDTLDFQPLVPAEGRRAWEARPPRALIAAQGRADSMWFFIGKETLYRFDPVDGRQLPPLTHHMKQPRLMQWGNRWALQDEADQRWSLLYRDQNAGEMLLPLPTGKQGLPVLDELDRVWTINDRGQVVRMEAVAGRLVEKEKLGGDAPVIDPTRVRSAWEWNELLLVVAGSASQVIDQVSRKTFSITKGDALDNLQWIQSERATLWVGTHQAILELDFGNVERGLQQRWLPGEAVHRDRAGRAWRHVQGAWQQAGAPRLPERRRVYPYHRGGAFEWTRGGSVRALEDTLGEKLPFDTEPLGLIGDTRGNWWFFDVQEAVLLRRERGQGGATLLQEQLRVPYPETLRLRTAYDIRSYQWSNPDQVTLTLADGREVAIRAFARDDRQIQVRAAAQTGPGRDGLQDVWPEMRGYLQTMPGGEQRFDPYVRFEKGRDGYLFAVRASGERLSLGERGTVQPNPLPNLDVTWLRYQVEADAFVVKTTDGERAFPAAQFLDPRRGLLATPSAILTDAGGALVGAFPSGTLRFPDGRLDFGQQAITLQPVAFRGAVQAYHHFFLDSEQTQMSVTANQAPLAHPLTYRFGPVTVVDDWRKQNIRFQAEALADPESIYRDGTFLWDRPPDHLTFDSEGRLLGISRLGLLEIDQLARFLPLPSGVSLDALRVTLESGGPPRLFAQNRWYSFQNGAWQITRGPEPDQDSRLWAKWLREHNGKAGRTEMGALQWRIDAAETAVRPLQNAVASRNSLIVLTKRQLIQYRTLPNNPPPIQHNLAFEADGTLLAVDDDQVVVSDGQSFFRWDPVANQLQQTAEPQDEETVLLEWKRLRFSRRDNRIIKELQVTDEGGSRRWLTYHFVNNRFPFDVVTGLAVHGKTLLVGTAAGLQHYEDTVTFPWEDVRRIWSPAAAEGTEQGVTRLGVDVARPNAMRVQFGTRAFQFTGDAAPRPIDPGDFVSIRADHPFWRWTRADGGRPQGRYRTGGGWSEPLRFTGGKAPHDQLQDMAFFDNRIFVLWRNGWVSQHLNQLAIDQATVAADLSAFAGDRLIVVPESRRFGSIDLAAGVYLRNKEGRLLRFNGRHWQAVDVPAIIAAMEQRESDQAVVHHPYLRLLRTPDGRRLQFEVRDQDGKWEALAWHQDGRLALDRWRRIFFEGEVPYALTEAGLVSVTIASDRHLQLNPADLEIARHAADGADLTAITDGGYPDGRFTVRLNERGDALYQMARPIENRRFGAFRPIQGADPFANRVMVRGEEPPWTWHVRNRQGGAPGEWHIDLPAFEVVLGNRGFQFDDIERLLPVPGGGFHVVSRGAGWFQIDGDDFHLKHWRRPAIKAFDPAKVTDLVTTWQEDRPTLAVTRDDGRRLFRDSGNQWQEVAALTALQAVSENRLFERNREGQLSIRARRQDRAMRRHLQDGRFSEDMALGLPLRVESDLFLPTAAGILATDATLGRGDIDPGPFPGLGEAGVPRVLLQHANRTLYLGEDGFYAIAAPHDKVLDLDPDYLRVATIVAVSQHGDRLLRFLRDSNERVHRDWVNLAGGALLTPETTPVLLGNLPWFRERPAQQQRLTKPVAIHFDAARLVWRNGDQDHPLYPLNDEQTHAVFTVNDSMYVLTNRQLLRLDLPRLWRQYQVD
ncbi:hypothetical protein [Acanthopleuribacter pedis]|uniref:Uncharacterized protein n=1 Tax=Acanthopleuribacter pedis TaxID=442870 RepID=A0A8J7QEK6_9BACT|nr:hypothetical protein [Acanthopleuribacter pedis]MBO1322824.1 hypothetical protein [Acanthopleuribacter pedis]